MPSLHHIWVTSQESPSRCLLVLHGILGSGQNFRSLAQRLVDAHPSYAMALVDLRFHGRSGPRPGPQSLEAAAEDVAELAERLPLPCTGVLGHSFGGKVATTFAARHGGDLERLWVLDSPPGARRDGDGSESTLRILDMLEQAPRHYAKRQDFVAHVESHGHPRSIGQWLGMNLERDADGYALSLDIGAIRALLDDYFQTDLWPFLGSTALPVSLVIGDRSEVWTPEERKKAEQLAEAEARVELRLVDDAGHWLHADNPEGTRAAIEADLPAP